MSEESEKDKKTIELHVSRDAIRAAETARWIYDDVDMHTLATKFDDDGMILMIAKLALEYVSDIREIEQAKDRLEAEDDVS